MNVSLKGLLSRPELNGSAGTVIAYSAERNRWQIGLDESLAIVYGTVNEQT